MVVVGYVRVSTGGQADDGVSLNAQRQKIEAWAKLHDEAELVIYEDAGISGGSMEQRPGLQEALREVCRRQGHACGLRALTTCSIDEGHAGDQRRTREAKAELVSLSERIDTTSASGKMVFRMLAVLAEFERDQVSERTRAAMGHLRVTGQRFSRFAPYGWDLDEERGTVARNQSEQEVLKRMRDLRADGHSYRDIAATLDAEGVPTKTGLRTWSSKAVWTAVRRAAS